MKRYNSVYEGVYTKPNEMIEEPHGDWVRYEDVEAVLKSHGEQLAASEWITDGLPTEDDCASPHYCVYDSRGCIVHYKLVGEGEPWKPVPNCEPYMKPKRRFKVFEEDKQFKIYNVNYNRYCVADLIPTREAAERIAAIYEEVMP